MFSSDYIRATLCFWAAFVLALFITFGLQTWLPQLMLESGYSLGSSLSFLLVLNLVTIPGVIFAGAMADMWNSKLVTIAAFALGAVSITLLSVPLLMAPTYALVGLAGVGGIGAHGLINAYVSGYYPAHGRSTALGWRLEIGRLGGICAPIILGLLLSSPLGIEWNFYAIALAALLGAVVILLLPGSLKASRGRTVAGD